MVAMSNSTIAATKAEIIIIGYIENCHCESGDDVAKVMEIIISKAARVIERYTTFRLNSS